MIYKRADSRFYWYEFTFGGRKYQGSTKLTNRVAAERVEAVLKANLAQARFGIQEPRPVPFFRDFAKRFLEKVRPGLRPNTVRGYEIAIRNLSPWFGGKRLDEIASAMVNEFRESRLREGRSGATVNRDLATLRRIFSVALKDDVVVSTPFAARRVEFCHERKRQRVLAYAEERKYLDGASPLLRDVATIILETGFRPGEVFNLRVSDVHLFAATPFIRVPGGKTKNAARDVGLTPRALDVLRRRCSQAEGLFIFPSRVGRGHDWNRPMNELEPAHQKALRKTGVAQFRLYDLRHTFASRAVEAEMDPLTLKALMGHADLKTTSRYVHLTFRHLAEAQQRLQRFRAEREIAEAAAASRSASEVVQ